MTQLNSDYLKILIVEDETPISDTIVRLLEPLKNEFPAAEIVITESLKRALEIVEEIPHPDVTILDLKLEDATPAQTIDKIKNIQSKSPVVIITSFPTEENLEKLKKLDVRVVDKFELTQSKKIFEIIIETILNWRSDWWIRVTKERERTNTNLSKLKELIYAK